MFYLKSSPTHYSCFCVKIYLNKVTVIHAWFGAYKQMKKHLNVIVESLKYIAKNFPVYFAEYKNDFQRLLFTSKFCRIALLHFQTSQTSTEIVLHTEYMF